LSELSIFTDETGDGGTNSSYYIVTLVFHDQTKDISPQIERLTTELDNIGFPLGTAVHTYPIIRKEDEYANLPLKLRRKVIDKLVTFSRRCDIAYRSFGVRKREYPDRLKMMGRLSREMALFFRNHAEYLLSFDRVFAYYDNGQADITNMINTIFNAFFFEVEFKKAHPSDYRLSQAADLFCTIELLAMKATDNTLTKSDLIFFESRRRILKDYVKTLQAKRFG
jgi:hypothetical protein